MTKIGSQQDYWNSRAKHFNDLDTPLIPGKQDIDFIKKHMVADGHTLVLGVTPQLCLLASKLSSKITSIDYAEEMIKALSLDGVEYICDEWNRFFEQCTTKFDNIVTDAGFVCLEFPRVWQQTASNIYKHLAPGGVFATRTFISTPNPPKENPNNPSLSRFISSLSKVDASWMLRPGHEDYKNYDVRYSFPPEKEILRTFNKLKLIGKLVPDYAEGEHFVSYAWQLA